jgi:predicted acetyltransferase
MENEQVELIEPCAELRADFLAMAREFQQEGDPRFNEVLNASRESFEQFVRRLQAMADASKLSSDQVPTTSFWLIRDGQRVLGTARVRHRPSRYGHIGYDIRPSERRKGYGTTILRLVLPKARRIGLKKVQLLCRADNIGSRRIIEKNGGVLESIEPADDGGQICRFWIDLTKLPQEQETLQVANRK